jgi:hypothetical protein
MAMGTWSCVDASGYTTEYVIGDGTSQISNGHRSGTWELDGTTLTLTETINYGDDTLHGKAVVDLTSSDKPTGRTISLLAGYSRSGATDQAEGATHYENGTVTVRLQHNSTLNQSADDVTCTKR